MKKTLKYNILLVLSLTLLFLSGCTYKTQDLSVSKIEKNFKISLLPDDIKDAVQTAAKENNWEIVGSSKNSVKLKKTFTKTRVHVGPRRWNKVRQNYDVYTVVSISSNTLSIVPLEDSVQKLEKHQQIDIFNDKLSNLKKSIFTHLITYAL